MKRLKTLTKSQKKYLEHVKFYCEQNGIKITLVDSDGVCIQGILGGGYFCDVNKEIRVAIGVPHWFETLIHEFNHAKQMVLNTEANKEYSEEELVSDEFFNLIKTFTKKENRKALKAIFEVEYECERWAVKDIKKYGLNINAERYTKGANAYLYFHRYFRETGNWYKTSPSIIKEILDVMPSNFNGTRRFFYTYKPLSKKMKRLFDLTQKE